MPKRTKGYHDWLIKRLSEPREAERYLKVAKADSNEMFLKALRNVAEAKKMAKVAEEAGVNRESLYKALSEQGNPAFFTVEAVLNAVGMTLMPERKEASTQTPPAPAIVEAQANAFGRSSANVGGSTKDFAGAWTTIYIGNTNMANGIAGVFAGNEPAASTQVVPRSLLAQISERQEAAQR